jgi:hypothetical protein
MVSRAFERETAASKREVARAKRAGNFTPAEFVLRLQPTAGNQAVLRALRHPLLERSEPKAVSRAVLQRKEDWNFTPADYAALVKQKKELRFDADSAWFPKALQENLLTTLKFALTSTKPARTAGVNVKDFYHGHFVIPKAAMTGDLTTKLSEFTTKSEALQGKALGGEWFDPVTKKNLAAYTKAMQETEKLATPILEAALKIEGAAVVYHTFETNKPSSMKYGSPTRNIRTPIGGTPAGHDPSGKETSANQYLDEYREVLQFAFLVDEAGVVHVTAGTVPNLSRVTGTPLGN